MYWALLYSKEEKQSCKTIKGKAFRAIKDARL